MKLPVLEEEAAYFSRSLFVPKSHVHGPALRGTLTFGEDSSGTPRVLVDEHPHHYEIPRSALTAKQLENLGCRLVDTRPRLFDRVDFRPKKDRRAHV